MRGRSRAAGTIPVLAVALVAAWAPEAGAPGATERAYDESAGVLGSVTRGEDPENDGTLPFTRSDLGLLALMGAGLIGTGMVVRRGVRAPG